MKKQIFLAIVFCFFSVALAINAFAVTFCEDLSCGERFSATSGWVSEYRDTTGQGHGFCFEILDKGGKFKVKVLAIVNGEAIHLDCVRNLSTQQDCIDWLLGRGYQLRQDGVEGGGASGRHLTVDRGPIYKIPSYLYSK